MPLARPVTESRLDHELPAFTLRNSREFSSVHRPRGNLSTSRICAERSPLDVVVGDHIESQAQDTVLNLIGDGNPPLYSGCWRAAGPATVLLHRKY